jgi:hypothetical protein
MLFKLCPCIQKLCNVYYPPTPSLSWIGQIKGHSLLLASARSAYWLAYSLHPRSLTPIWSWMQGCTKLMPSNAHPWIITSHPCPPKTHGYGWAWACAWAPNAGLCSCVKWPLGPLTPSRALHWVPIPMPMPKPTHACGFWVGMDSILLFMGGHGWVLFPGGCGWA